MKIKGNLFQICLYLTLLFTGSVLAQTNYTPYTFITLAGSGAAGSIDGYGTNAVFGNVRDVAVDSAGNVYVAGTAEANIRRITPDGLVTTIAGMAGVQGTNDGIGEQARFIGPQGVALDRNGNLYVADSAARTVRMLTPTGPSRQTNWSVVTIAGQPNVKGSADGTNHTATFFYPRGLTVDAAGNIYVTDFYNHNLRKIAPQGTNWVVTTLAGPASGSGFADGTNASARFANPTGIVTDAATNLYIADLANDAIREVSPVGTNWVVTTIAGKGAIPGFADAEGTNALFNGPNGIALGNDGKLYVPEIFNDTIRRLTLTGSNWTVSTLAGVPGTSGSADGTGSGATFNGPVGVALDAVANIYIGDIYNHKIRKGWLAGTTPVCLLGTPVITNNQTTIGLTVVTGSVTNFTLLQAGQLNGLWVTNTGASFTTQAQNVSYKIAAPLQTGQSGFYRVQVQ